MKKEPITVGRLRRELDGCSDDCILEFGFLDFNRVKKRGDKLVSVEFDQSVLKTEDGKWIVHEP